MPKRKPPSDPDVVALLAAFDAAEKAPPPPPLTPSEERKRLAALAVYPKLLFPGEIFKGSPDSLDTILQRHVEWAEGVLRRADLPTGYGLHARIRSKWVPARLSGTFPRLTVHIGRKVYRPGEKYPRLTSASRVLAERERGERTRITAELLAAETILWAKKLRDEVDAGRLHESLGCLYQMMLRGRFGLYMDRIDADAKRGMKARLGKTVVGRDTRNARDAAIRREYEAARKRRPSASDRELEERVAERFDVSRRTVQRARPREKVAHT